MSGKEIGFSDCRSIGRAVADVLDAVEGALPSFAVQPPKRVATAQRAQNVALGISPATARLKACATPRRPLRHDFLHFAFCILHDDVSLTCLCPVSASCTGLPVYRPSHPSGRPATPLGHEPVDSTIRARRELADRWTIRSCRRHAPGATGI